MPRFLPFNALLGHPAKGEDLADLVTPSFEELHMLKRQKLASRHRNNFVRFESGRDMPGDRPGEDRYARAASALKEAMDTHRIARQQVAYYFMEISGNLGKSAKEETIRGFVGMVELNESSRSSSFEMSPEDEVIDRVKQLLSLEVQTAPVTLGFRTTASAAHQMESIAARVMHHKPVIAFNHDDGVRYRLRKIDPDAFSLEPLLSKKNAVILDGAARYEAALRHARTMREADKAPSPFRAYNFTLAWMIDLDRNPIEFLPRHRALLAGSIPDNDGPALLTRLEDHFEIERYKLTSPGSKEAELVNLLDEMDCIGRLNHCYGFYMGDKAYYLLYLRDAASYEKLSRVQHSRRWKRLDVSILHAIVFDEILDNSAMPEQISMPLSARYAVSLVDDGFASAAFLLNKPITDHLIDIAEAGEPLPARSMLLARRPLVGAIMAGTGMAEYVGEDA